jgi:serine/threonine protein kinase/WD40 repeat protein
MAQSEERVRDPVEELAEDFLERYRRGEHPSLSEFIARAPEHADEIHELFPALVLMEQAGPAGSAPRAPGPSAEGVDRLGEYRIIREIGRGGMGIVYEAEQEALGRLVALKVLRAPADGECLLRFRREARAAARLHHTNIVPVFDIGERDGIHYYAMQFIQGQGLDEVITELYRLRGDRNRPVRAEAPPWSAGPGLAGSVPADHFQGENQKAGLPEPPSAATDESTRSSASSVLNDQSDFSTKSDFQYYRSVARIGLQVASALAHAHDQRVLHRDIKPSNLLLDARGMVWVTDFGLAKEDGEDITRTGDVVGTLRYMAPERFTGVADARSDIYSLGLTLYELLTLRPAFLETDRVRLVQAIATQEPKSPRRLDPQLPRDLETIVLKAINKDPSRRYAAAAELEEDLRRFLADRPIQARRTSSWERVRRWCRRNPGWAATIATVLGLLSFIAIAGSVLSLNLQQALSDVQAADAEKTEKLWQAYLERARALRSSGRVGQRFEALKAIREAAKIKMTTELRDEAVAALVLPDVAIAREWQGGTEDTLSFAHDAKFERYARLSKQGEITLCRVADDGEQVIARLDVNGQPRFLGVWMSPDGRFLACGHSGWDEGLAGGVRIWKLDGPAPVVHFDVPEGMRLSALTFHADGKTLAIGHPDGNISVFDLETRKLKQRQRSGPAPDSLAFHPKDQRLAVACRESVRVLDLDKGTELVLRLPKIDTWSYGLAWHPQGRLLAATADDMKIHLFDTDTGAEAVPPLDGHAGSGIVMAFNHKGDRLLSAGWDKQTRLWDTATGRLLLVMPGYYGRQFSGDDSQIGLEQSGTKLRIWQLADGRELRTIRRYGAEHAEIIHSPVLHADEQVLAAATNNGLAFFDLDTCKQLVFVRFPNHIVAAPRTFDRAEGWMMSGGGGATVWPVQHDPTAHLLHIGPPRWLAPAVDPGADASADGRIRAVPQRYRPALVFDRNRPGSVIQLDPQEDVRCCAVSPDGRLVATCSWFWDGRTNSVRIWKIEDGKASRALELPVEGHAIARFSPDGRWLATFTGRQGTQLWEVETWRPAGRFDNSFGWSADGRLLAVHDQLGVIRLLQPGSGKEVFRLTGPEAKSYYAACLTRDGARLIATVADNSILCLWDLRLIRTQLRALGMDWAWPEFAPPIVRPPVRVAVDPGGFRQPVFASDRHDVAAFSVLIALQPINPDGAFHRGLAFSRLRDWQRAIVDYEMFLASTPSDDPRRPEVVRHYAEACNNLAWAAVVKPKTNGGVGEAALLLARRAVELDPNFNHQNTLGVVLYRVGQYDEAIRCLEPNVKLSGRLAAFDLYFLAMSHHRLGQPAKAREYFDRANASANAETGLSAGQRQELAGFRAEAEGLGVGKTP